MSRQNIRSGLRHGIALAGALGCALAPALPAHAQAFPAKNIQMIVPYTPGGSADLFSRVMAQKLGEMWGRNIVEIGRASCRERV